MMNWRKQMLRKILALLIGQILLAAVTVGVYWIIGRFDLKVIWGALAGVAIAVANHSLLMLFANIAADKAEAQDVAGGQKLVQLSYTGRLVGIFLVLLLCAKSGWFDLIALVLPLLLNGAILKFTELTEKKGGEQV